MPLKPRRVNGVYLVLCGVTHEVLAQYHTEIEQWYHIVTGHPPSSLREAKRLHRGGKY